VPGQRHRERRDLHRTEAMPWLLPLRAVVIVADRALRRAIVHGLRQESMAVIEGVPSAAMFDYMRSLRRTPARPADPVLIVADVDVPPGEKKLMRMCLVQVNWAPLAILITAANAADEWCQGQALGNARCVAVFHKPFDVDDLRTAAAYYARRATPRGSGRRVRFWGRGGEASGRSGDTSVLYVYYQRIYVYV